MRMVRGEGNNICMARGKGRSLRIDLILIFTKGERNVLNFWPLEMYGSLMTHW